jgi:hypothetical protein
VSERQDAPAAQSEAAPRNEVATFDAIGQTRAIAELRFGCAAVGLAAGATGAISTAYLIWSTRAGLLAMGALRAVSAGGPTSLLPVLEACEQAGRRKPGRRARGRRSSRSD